MKSYFDCIPCMVSHVLHVCEMTELEDTKKEHVLREALRFMSNMDMTMSPPEQARELHRILHQISSNDDPYLQLKDDSTKFALKILPELKDNIARCDDRKKAFELALRYAVGGNIIDFGADRHFKLADARRRMLEVESMPMDESNIQFLQHKLREAENVVYILDNCGEAVFDSLLLDFFPENTVLAVRGAPILNDITRRETAASGLEGFRVIDTGDSTPGVSLSFSSSEMLDALAHADLIIAKGQGNFETLNESAFPIFFLLRVKCPIIANLINAPIGSLQLIDRNLK